MCSMVVGHVGPPPFFFLEMPMTKRKRMKTINQVEAVKLGMALSENKDALQGMPIDALVKFSERALGKQSGTIADSTVRKIAGEFGIKTERQGGRTTKNAPSRIFAKLFCKLVVKMEDTFGERVTTAAERKFLEDYAAGRAWEDPFMGDNDEGAEGKD